MNPGDQLGPYEILEPLGAGGMGEVYLGEDTRLGRKVAIKVLPAEFASDPERLARFEQEARAAAALNHPHIAVVHDIGTEGDTHFMVQECLEGQSLGERLDKGALPLDKALDLSIEVGEALVAAHKAGIIHRDLKPDNIFVSEEGHVKVLDFGLAKLTEVAAPAGSELSMSPTMVGTAVGQLMGTAGYMAPEQVNGEEVDHRADLFSLGVVLYEMITGRRAFAGESVVQTLNRIVHEDPTPLADIVDSAPAELHRIIRKCLAKEANRRYQLADDLAIDLRQLRDDITAGVALPMRPESNPASDATLAPRPAAGIPRTTGAVLGLTLVVASALVTWFAGGLRSPPPEQTMRRFEINLPGGQAFPAGGGRNLALSPDGNHLVYRAEVDSVIRLYHRRLAGWDATPLAGTENGRYFSFSPDSQSIAFVLGTDLATLDLGTGERFALCSECSGSSQGFWYRDEIVFTGLDGALSQISTRGATSTLATNETFVYGRPVVLPGGGAVLFERVTRDSRYVAIDREVAVLNLDTSDLITIAEVGTDPAYVAETGHILYAAQDALHAVPFDAQRLEKTGEPAVVLQDLRVETFGAAQYSVADDGTLAYVAAGESSLDFSLVSLDRSGAAREVLVSGEGDWSHPRPSPDGRYVAFLVEGIPPERDAKAYIYDVARSFYWPLPLDGTIYSLAWSASGDWLYFSADNGADADIFRTRPDSSGIKEPIVGGEFDQHVGGTSSDGRLLLYVEEHPDSAGDLWVAFLDEPGRREPYRTTAADEREGRFSSDGKWVVYETLSGDADEYAALPPQAAPRRVFVSPYPSDDTQTPVSTAGGYRPRWSADGGELFYQHETDILAVDVLDTADRFSVGEPRVLHTDTTSLGFSGLEISPDRDRLIAVQRTTLRRNRINVVLNWFEELKERVPTGGR